MIGHCNEPAGKMIKDHAYVDEVCAEDQPDHIDDVEPEGHGEFECIEDENLHMDDADVTWFNDTEDESESDDDTGTAPAEHVSRVRALESQPEYVRLKELGLSIRPPGCSLGIHPGAGVWRSSAGASSHFGRSYPHARTSWQALLRVMELCLEAYLEQNSGVHDSKMVKHQLSRIRKQRQQEPPHKD